MKKVSQGSKSAIKIINYERKEMLPLTKKEEREYRKQNCYHICKEEVNAIHA